MQEEKKVADCKKDKQSKVDKTKSTKKEAKKVIIEDENFDLPF